MGNLPELAKSKSPASAVDVSKRKSPQAHSKPAKARESGIIKRARESAVVESQAIWNSPSVDAPAKNDAPKQVKRRRI
jgi:hypothetical protein